MKCYPSEVIKVAEAEIGYKEKASNSQLDSKTANAGSNNWNKYARDFDEKYPDFYNGKKNGYDWCDIFVDWCFVTAYGREEAQRLLCQPDHSLGAGCTFSYGYYKAKGQVGKVPKLGAQIFFGKYEDDLDHTGIVVDFDNTYVWTVEGNSGNEVKSKKYNRNYYNIFGYGYPAFDAEQPQPTPTPAPREKWTGGFPKLPSRGYYLKGDGYNTYTDYRSDIKLIQEFLNWAINAQLEIDGCYGAYTTRSVTAFQKVTNIRQDGSYGEQTLAKAKSFEKDAKSYVVKAGDTLSSIADKFGVTVDYLAEKNGISDPNVIYVGQKIYI